MFALPFTVCVCERELSERETLNCILLFLPAAGNELDKKKNMTERISLVDAPLPSRVMGKRRCSVHHLTGGYDQLRETVITGVCKVISPLKTLCTR